MVGAVFQPLDVDLLGSQTYGLADDFGAAPSGDPDLFLEHQPDGHDHLLLDDGNDQHPVLLTRCGYGLDRHATRHALDRHLLLSQRDLDDIVPLFDLALHDLEPLFGQLDALQLVEIGDGLAPFEAPV